MTVYRGLLQRRLELFLNGAWVDFSDRLLTQTLSPNPGRTSGGSRVSPSTINFSLDNPLGDITPYNAASTYYPHVDVGLLVRWSVYWDGVWYVRGVFEATDVEPHWPYGDLSDGTATGQPGESYVAIAAADILQRLSDDQQPLRSAAYRSITGMSAGGYTPHEYWPMEDGTDAKQFASAVGGSPMVVRAGVVPGTDSTLPGSLPLPELTEAANVSAGATVRTYTDQGQWVAQFVAKVPDDGGPTFNTLLTATLSPAVSRYVQVGVGPSGLILQIYSDAGADSGGWADAFDTSLVYGQWCSFVLAAVDDASGTTDRMSVSMYDTRGELLATISQLVGVGYYGTVRRLDLNGVSGVGGGAGEAHYGHLAFYTDPAWTVGVDDVYNARAAGGWVGEMAHDRAERLCREQQVLFTTTATTSQDMGPQRSDTLMTLLRECEDTDLGILHAQREANGLQYRSSTELYNQAPSLILDAANSEVANPFRPSATAKHLVNDVTVSRPEGSSARVTSQQSIDKVGLRARGYNANTETDGQLPDLAGWLLNLGTPDGMYYPSVTSELTIATQVAEDWLALNLGDRIQVINLPPQHPADTVDLIVDGYTEPHSPSRWTPQINCSPASPWDVAELDDDDSAKLDTAGCVMQAGATSGATTFTVATTALPPWTTDAGEMPIPILVSGQVNSVTAVSNVGPSFVAAGTVAHANNASVTPTMPAGVQAGDLLLVWAAIRNSGTGTVNTPSGYTVLLTSGNATLLGKVHTGTESAPTITFAGGVANADTSAQMAAFRGVGITVHASSAQLNGSAANVSYPALDISRDNCVVLYLGWKQDDWTSVAAIAGATEIGEPDTTTGDDQGIVWDYVIQTTATAIAAGSFTVTGGASAISRGAVIALTTDVQTLTVTRGTNNVTKAIPIGSTVIEHRGARLAL